MTIIEPCAGDNSLTNELVAEGARVITNDIDSGLLGHDYYHDATQREFWNMLRESHGRPDWVITNPPFLSAYPILRNALDIALRGVIFLLRISFLEPTKERAVFLSECPPSMYGVLPRWSYRNNGKSDSATTAWIGWFHNCPVSHCGIWIEPNKPAREKIILIGGEENVYVLGSDSDGDRGSGGSVSLPDDAGLRDRPDVVPE